MVAILVASGCSAAGAGSGGGDNSGACATTPAAGNFTTCGPERCDRAAEPEKGVRAAAAREQIDANRRIAAGSIAAGATTAAGCRESGSVGAIGRSPSRTRRDPIGRGSGSASRAADSCNSSSASRTSGAETCTSPKLAGSRASSCGRAQS